MSAMYDYLFLNLAPSGAGSPCLTLAEHLEARGGLLTPPGSQLLGAFGPQLGWQATEAAVVLGWTTDSPDRQASACAKWN